MGDTLVSIPKAMTHLHGGSTANQFSTPRKEEVVNVLFSVIQHYPITLYFFSFNAWHYETDIHSTLSVKINKFLFQVLETMLFATFQQINIHGLHLVQFKLFYIVNYFKYFFLT